MVTGDFCKEATMIQDILPCRYHNEYHPRAPRPEDWVFWYQDRKVFAHPDQTFFRRRELGPQAACTYLFEIDNAAFYLCDLSAQNGILIDIEKMRTYQPQELAFAAVTGWQLFAWMRDSAFCGRCGTRMQPDRKERAMRCPQCGSIVYPRIAPAAIIGILNQEGKLLLTKYAHGVYTHYALVAGYAEIGETIEQTVHREVKEETGLEVTDLKYYKSQPWSLSGTLLFGFWCHVRGSDRITLDTSELKLAEWHAPDDFVLDSSSASLTHEMIEKFQKGQVQ